MIKGENQHINIVVRAIIVEEGQLVVTEWKSNTFPSLFLHMLTDVNFMNMGTTF